jgi:hypothetical protein
MVKSMYLCNVIIKDKTMDRIKRLSTRVSENSDWANRCRKYLDVLPSGAMKKGAEIVASGRLYELPYIPYTGCLANKLYFTENDNGGVTLYLLNGYIQELAVISADFESFERTMPNRKEYECYIESVLEWFRNNI